MSGRQPGSMRRVGVKKRYLRSGRGGAASEGKLLAKFGGQEKTRKPVFRKGAVTHRTHESYHRPESCQRSVGRGSGSECPV